MSVIAVGKHAFLVEAQAASVYASFMQSAHVANVLRINRAMLSLRQELWGALNPKYILLNKEEIN